MPKKKYALAYDEPERLEIAWNGGSFRVQGGITITCDKTLLGSFADRNDLEQGQEFQLSDGSILRVQLSSNYFKVFHNGKVVQWVSDAKRLRDWCFFFAGLSLLRWLISFVFKLDGLNLSLSLAAWASMGSLLFASGFLVVGLLIVRRSYLLGLMTFMLIFAFSELFFDIFIQIQGNGSSNISAVLLLTFSIVVFVGLPGYSFLKMQLSHP